MVIKLKENFLIESKADQQRLVDFAGQETADKFFSMRKKLHSPYNDVYYWIKNSTPRELRDYLDSYFSKSDEKRASKEGAELLFSNEYWKVYHITTFEASMLYGKHTRWCITSYDWTTNKGDSRFWDQYTSRGCKFYFYISSFLPENNNKFCLVECDGRFEVYNAPDKQISPKHIPDERGRLEAIPVSSRDKLVHIDGLPDITYYVGNINEYNPRGYELPTLNDANKYNLNGYIRDDNFEPIVSKNPSIAKLYVPVKHGNKEILVDGTKRLDSNILLRITADRDSIGSIVPGDSGCWYQIVSPKYAVVLRNRDSYYKYGINSPYYDTISDSLNYEDSAIKHNIDELFNEHFGK